MRQAPLRAGRRAQAPLSRKQVVPWAALQVVPWAALARTLAVVLGWPWVEGRNPGNWWAGHKGTGWDPAHNTLAGHKGVAVDLELSYLERHGYNIPRGYNKEPRWSNSQSLLLPDMLFLELCRVG